ncbi:MULTISPECIES: hypothetical protein [Pseudomonas]|uniref:hypothetical protein n=1 Tax=Pseudomonas TaxID=286 RepID=UPI000707A973|nr:MULTISPECIES: hypothetical protein [Pseudomonas]EKX2115218.1 hypothetical protein [Pseudomonas aeruginosa]KAF0592014.1 hypothetical protein PAPB9_05068 [Pseudomonas aeruginosa]KQK62699.1 hypothetical protein AOX61_30105 [Pseudomonas aeruginosa]KQK64444.1 hypothetical protein AOX62_25685 [Pseudomonas aeruginosa]MBG5708019.1 hypothetical protein [Pseudomonas aeruginosa]
MKDILKRTATLVIRYSIRGLGGIAKLLGNCLRAYGRFLAVSPTRWVTLIPVAFVFFAALDQMGWESPKRSTSYSQAVAAPVAQASPLELKLREVGMADLCKKAIFLEYDKDEFLAEIQDGSMYAVAWQGLGEASCHFGPGESLDSVAVLKHQQRGVVPLLSSLPGYAEYRFTLAEDGDLDWERLWMPNRNSQGGK